MTALVTIETLLLIIFSLLLVGLMRSHAEILKWMASTEPGDRASVRVQPTLNDLPIVPPDRQSDAPAPPIIGTTLDNQPARVAFGGGRNALLAFLSSGCASCISIWDGMRAGVSDDLPETFDLLVVTRDRNQESPSKLASLAPGDAELIMSSDAWQSYEVPRHPYFVYVNGQTGTIAGEGTAESWDQVMSLLRDFFDDLALAAGNGGRPTLSRIEREDAELAAAGIHPGHPSLFAPPFADQAEGAQTE